MVYNIEHEYYTSLSCVLLPEVSELDLSAPGKLEILAARNDIWTTKGQAPFGPEISRCKDGL